MDTDIAATINITGTDIAATITTHIKYNGVLDIANKKLRIAMTLGIDVPGHGKQEFIGDGYVINGWQYIHTKGSDTESWVKKECSDELLETRNQFCQQVGLLKAATDITFLGSEKVDGIDCYILLFKPDTAALAKYLQYCESQPQQTEAVFEGDDLIKMFKAFEIKEWITRDEYLPMKLDGNIDIETTSLVIMPWGVGWGGEYANFAENIKMQTKFKDFNQPVDIELPAEALQAKQI
jgi:hypothetical protein